MQKTALVIMAAGIGSRFGKGIKQLAPVGIVMLTHWSLSKMKENNKEKRSKHRK